MPPPAAFIDLTGQTFPYSRTVTQAEFNAGTYGDVANEIYFKFIPTADCRIGALATSGNLFIPRTRLYQSDALTLLNTQNSAFAWSYTLSAGVTYYIQIVHRFGGASDFDFETKWDTAEFLATAQGGQVVINDDIADNPATVFNIDGTFRGFLRNVPTGEIGHALPSGISLWHDRDAQFGAASRLVLTDTSFNLITAPFNTSPPLTSAHPRINNNGTDFFLARADTGNEGGIHKITAAGAASGIIANIGLIPSSIAISPDGKTLYYIPASGSDDHIIKRWDLVSNAALSNLYTDTELATDSGVFAQTANLNPGDILYLADGTLVTHYHNFTRDKSVLLHIDGTSGSLLHSYEYPEPQKINHLAYAADNPNTVIVWSFLDAVAHTGRIETIRLSDGAALTSFDTDFFSGGTNPNENSDQLFGPSASCTVVIVGYNSSNPCCSDTSPPTTDTSGDGTLSSPEGTCCASSGPGGAPTGTGYGDNSPDGPGDSIETPRVVPPGGVTPSYSTCSSSGGVPATASDPTNAQNMASAKTPLVHLKWTFPDGSIRRYGKRAFTSGNGQAVSARVLKWGPVVQTLADRHGSFQASSFTITLADTDRTLRGLLSAASTKYIDGKEVEILIETAANAALSVTPLVLARGIVTNWKFSRDLTFELTVTDPLGYRFSSVSLDRPLPHLLIRKELFPDAPEQSVGRALPIIYGEYSDDYTWFITPSRIPVGICPVIDVGQANSINGLGVGDGSWRAFVVAGHAIFGIQSLFASNLAPTGPGPVRMSTGTYGVDFLVPGVNIAKYHDVVGSDGVTERIAFLCARGPRMQAHIDGQVPITVNVCGREATGDGTGAVITDIEYQFQHFLQHEVVDTYRTGNYGAVPTFTDGTAKVRTSSFSTCRTTHLTRVGAGYVGAMYLGTQKPAREWSAEFQNSGDMRLGVNNHGQLLAISLDDQSSTSGLTTFTAEDEIVQKSFEITPEADEIFNIYTYEYGPEAAAGRVAGLAQTIRHSGSIANHGERIAQARLYKGTLHKATADDVANRTMLRSINPPTRVQFMLDLRGVALSIGQLIGVTHYQGIGASGWTDRVLMVTGITTNPDEDQFSTVIDCEDVQDYVPGAAGWFKIDSGQIDVQTIG
jgi:hypothetical protein